ncbi:hypothetical protein HELRODRAFT_178515 [Helobdella robusta]|uniref:Apple domain-containing protein n=1 Tax=Helobdella robusta TaxID=6412 RepID=T1FDA4_HELRO|nr:hypothetical protein HELRODRAFT_178515 [Helobdella robusta]ESN97066.1 hypothetical protein HELRODRAFT_178515 [Helobdella robusta]
MTFIKLHLSLKPAEQNASRMFILTIAFLLLLVVDNSDQRICRWIAYQKKFRQGGMEVPRIRSLDGCKDACLASTTCKAIAWGDPMHTPRPRCLIFRTSALPNERHDGYTYYRC